MIVLGVDPGIERIGWAVIEKVGSKLTPIRFGLIKTPRIPTPARLLLIRQEFTAVLHEFKPDEFATEQQVFAANKTTALDVAKALGVMLAVSAELDLPWAEYSPPEVKKAVTGVGQAEKHQVQFMVEKILGLTEPVKPDDVADALAIAVCHALKIRG